jgi:D-glycerate 3-kinase
VTPAQINAFVARHRLPQNFSGLIENHYSPLARWAAARLRPGTPFLLGINGAQGTGKTTLADYLQLALATDHQRQVAVLSLDDFYLTRIERQRLADKVHPLLTTRGVPGTHDLTMLSNCIARLRNLGATQTLALPRFDKAHDDRVAREAWPEISGPIDLIILEGWCVGSMAQSDDTLLQAINNLEQRHDGSAVWRRFVNRQLGDRYADLFAELDALVFLQAPNFDAVHRWRLEQEQKLALGSNDPAADIMSSGQLRHFIQHYERITRANLATLPQHADVVLVLGEDHGCVETVFR